MFIYSIKTRSLSFFAAAAVLSLGAASAFAADDKHEHPDKGPHKGALIELGEEEFHAEILHDDKTHTITIYVLDGAAASVIAIEAKEILVNLKNGKKVKQFKLAAVPQKGERMGLSSRFVSQNEELCEFLDDHGTEARLNLKIKGKSYTAKIPHDHDHEHKK